MCGCLSDLCLIIISVLFPPLPVWIRRGLCSMDSLINILLCVLGYFPGLIHSWYIIAKYPPYTVQNQSKIYYIYHNDLEAQQGRSSRRHGHGHGHDQEAVHHHHHSHNNTYINQEPSSSANPTYGAINENVPNPPPYTEVDNKHQT